MTKSINQYVNIIIDSQGINNELKPTEKIAMGTSNAVSELMRETNLLVKQRTPQDATIERTLQIIKYACAEKHEKWKKIVKKVNRRLGVIVVKNDGYKRALLCSLPKEIIQAVAGGMK